MSFMSWRFAPLTTSDRGTPRSSTNKLRFLPFFSPIRRIGSDALDGQWGLNQGPIDALPLPSDAFHVVILGQACPPQIQEETRAVPLLKMVVDRTGAAEFFRKRFPLAAGAQDIYDSRENLPRGHGLPPTA